MTTAEPFQIRPGEAGLRRNQLIDARPGRVRANVEDGIRHFLAERIAHVRRERGEG